MKQSVTEPGTGNQQTAKTTQILDQYGNATQAVVYPYNNTTTPLRTFNSTYLNSGSYPSHYIFDRLLTTTLTTGGVTKTLVTNSYDYGSTEVDTTCACTPFELDAQPPIPASQRGYLASATTPAVTTWYSYLYGQLQNAVASDGSTTQAAPSLSTNYAAPTTITTQSYAETISYNSWLGITQTTGLNGEQLYMAYDWVGRPSTATSPFGATTTYAYATAIPLWQSTAGPGGFTKTTLDGLGRTIKIERGPDATHIQSVTETVYAPCACSPLGKIQKVSAPYQPGASTINWTVYTYDGIGRTLSVTQPDGASTTTYAYAGNQTTVTDPAGKWKRFTSDVEGNLTSVAEPDPASQPGGTLATNYTYDWMKHLTGVSMPRGATTQTRTFVYDDAGRLTSATNPESGTVTYTYNSDNTLWYKHDAKGQDTVYTYDDKKRVTVIKRYPGGKTGYEDVNQRVSYSYDTNAVLTGFSQFSRGRLTAVQYTIYDNDVTTPVTELYSYNAAGAVTAKQFRVRACGVGGYDSNGAYQDDLSGCSDGYVEADYAYTNSGQIATYGVSGNLYNPNYLSAPTYTYAYDSMGRPTTLTDNTGCCVGEKRGIRFCGAAHEAGY